MTWETHLLNKGELGEWREAWDGLNARYYRRNPYFDSRFVGPLLTHFGSGLERLCVHRRGYEIDGMLILRPRRAGTWSCFVPAQAQIAPIFLKRPEDISELFAALPGYVWCIELINQDPNYSELFHLKESPSSYWNDHALTIEISLSGQFETYWSARPKKLQNNLKRYIRRAAEAGHELRLVRHTSVEATREGLERYGELESLGWKGKAGTAVHHNNPQGKFYGDVLSRFACSGDCSVYELYFGNQLVASRLCVASDDMIVMLKTSYDESQSAFAPGRVLLYMVLREEFSNARSRRVEFYTDATVDQIQWCTDQRRIKHLTIYRNTWSRQATEGLKRVKDRLNPPPPLPLREYELDADLPKDIREMLDDAERNYAEWGLEWFRHIARHALPKGETACCVATGGGDEGPLAALAIRKDDRARTLHSLTTFYSTLYSPLTKSETAPTALCALFSALGARAQGWSRMTLFPLDRDERSFGDILDALRESGWRPYPYFGFGNWFLPCGGLSFDEYFSGRPSLLRHTIERKERKFLSGGRGSFVIVQNGTDLDTAIAAYEQIYRASWKTSEPFPDFMPSLIRLCALRGWLRLGLAYFDGEPVAAQVWIVNAGKASIYKLAYDERYAKLSAGTLLSKFLMRHVLDEDKVREVDYLVGDDSYKKDWMSHRRERWGIVAYNPSTFKGLLGAAREAAGRQAKRAIAGLVSPKSIQGKA